MRNTACRYQVLQTDIVHKTNLLLWDRVSKCPALVSYKQIHKFSKAWYLITTGIPHIFVWKKEQPIYTYKSPASLFWYHTMDVRMASKRNISSTCSVKSTHIRIDAKQQGLRHRIYHHFYHVKDLHPLCKVLECSISKPMGRNPKPIYPSGTHDNSSVTMTGTLFSKGNQCSNNSQIDCHLLCSCKNSM